MFVPYEKEDGTCDVEDKKVWKCSNVDCKGKDVFEITRFKIPIVVQDCSGSVSLTLFDYDCFKLLGKSAQHYLDQEDELLNTGEFPPSFPDDFKNLIGKKFEFQIKVMEYNINNKIEHYGVSLLSDDSEIVTGLYKKWKIDQFEQSYSTGCVSSSDVQVTKDTMSGTGDNETPMSLLNEVVDKVEIDNLKRNLDDVFDVDDIIEGSSTKRRSLDDKDSSVVGVTSELLVPKIEK